VSFSALAERPWKGISFLVLDAAGFVVFRNEVRLPYRERAGAIRFWRVKRADGREWFEPKPTEAGGLIPFGLETLPLHLQGDELEDVCLFITEGESDCLALREVFAEWSRFPRGVRVVALPGARSWRRTWRMYFARFPVIVVVPDGDPSGDRMARAVRADLPWSRLVLLPEGKDVREIVQSGGGEALLPYLEDAEWRWRVDAAMRLSDRNPAHAFPSFLRSLEEVAR
jgi:Toprim-like